MNKLKFGIPVITDKRRLIETGKSALIVILAVTALILSIKVWLFPGVSNSDVFNGVLALQGQSTDSAGGGYTAAATPFCIVVTPVSGTHCALIYDDKAVAAAYERFSANLGEALGSAGEPEAISDAEWEAALSGCGVYFDFLSDQPLDALASWFDITASGGTALHTARRICLSVDSSGVSLYYVRAREGTAYRCSTKLSSADISGKLQGYLPDGSNFNFELESPFSLVDSCAVITPGLLSIPSVTAGNPVSSDAEDDEILASFGMNSILAVPYAETDGSEVFVEGETTLRIETNGTVIFGRTGHVEQAGSLTTAQAIETVRATCEKTLGRLCGSATLYLSYIWHNPDTDVYYIRFDYALNGLPVSFTDGASAAAFTLTGDVITSATMIFREYSTADTTEAPLPALQTAAAVQAAGGGEPVLSYTDDLTAVAVNWTIK